MGDGAADDLAEDGPIMVYNGNNVMIYDIYDIKHVHFCKQVQQTLLCLLLVHELDR